MCTNRRYFADAPPRRIPVARIFSKSLAEHKFFAAIRRITVNNPRSPGWYYGILTVNNAAKTFQNCICSK
jgi:hypothetical protein